MAYYMVEDVVPLHGLVDHLEPDLRRTPQKSTVAIIPSTSTTLPGTPRHIVRLLLVLPHSSAPAGSPRCA
jgi:hypothetical protein